MPAGNILVADDDSAIRTVLNQALSRAGYDVRSTGNAATLWRWVSQGDGDLVITDVVMPDENAFDLLPRIKKLRPELPVIIMSAQNTFMTAIRASERGAYESLPNPAPARSSWRARCTITASAARARSSRSTWRRSRAISWNLNCSGTKKARSPAQTREVRAVLNKPRVARCSSTKSATCRWKRRR